MADFGDGWYYNDVTGGVFHFNYAESLLYVVQPYWHGPYKTQQLAVKHAGVKGATAQVNQSIGSGITNTAGNAASNIASSATSGLSSTVENLITGTNATHLITRVVEVVAGLALLYVGAKEMIGPTAAGQTIKVLTTPARKAASGAKKTAKVAAGAAFEVP
jgi:hypothetical protein